MEKTKPDHVCKLHKAIYGLKQSPRAWFDKFSNYLLEYGFFCSKHDPSLFVYTNKTDILILLLYVDDMVLTGSSIKLIEHLLASLKDHFRLKDMGKLHYFLGIQAQYHEHGLFLSQQRYAEDLLAVAGMSECVPMLTPLRLQPNKIPDHDTPFSDPKYFRSLAGKLQYITMTRLDLQFAVNFVCQKMHAPTLSDFNLLKRILRYLRGTIDYGISFFKHTDFTLAAYSYSDWAGCPVTRRSTGGCTFLGNNIISWSAKKQQSVARSSTEAEYRALCETSSEFSWLTFLLRDLGISQPVPATLYGDNLSSVYLTANPVLHPRSKHFEADFHFVRQRVALGSLIVKHIPAAHQLADIFTMSLPQAAFTSLRFKLGVRPPPTPSLRGLLREARLKL